MKFSIDNLYFDRVEIDNEFQSTYLVLEINPDYLDDVNKIRDLFSKTKSGYPFRVTFEQDD